MIAPARLPVFCPGVCVKVCVVLRVVTSGHVGSPKSLKSLQAHSRTRGTPPDRDHMASIFSRREVAPLLAAPLLDEPNGELADQTSKLSKVLDMPEEALRGVRLELLLGGFAALFAERGQAARDDPRGTFEKSLQVRMLHSFCSHSWATPRLLKYVALIVHYNLVPAIRATMATYALLFTTQVTRLRTTLQMTPLTPLMTPLFTVAALCGRMAERALAAREAAARQRPHSVQRLLGTAGEPAIARHPSGLGPRTVLPTRVCLEGPYVHTPLSTGLRAAGTAHLLPCADDCSPLHGNQVHFSRHLLHPTGTPHMPFHAMPWCHATP